MDIADSSDDRIQHTVEDGVAKARRELTRSLPYIGLCHWCTSPVDAARAFCSRDCSDDYDRHMARTLMNGK